MAGTLGWLEEAYLPLLSNLTFEKDEEEEAENLPRGKARVLFISQNLGIPLSWTPFHPILGPPLGIAARGLPLSHFGSGIKTNSIETNKRGAEFNSRAVTVEPPYPSVDHVVIVALAQTGSSLKNWAETGDLFSRPRYHGCAKFGGIFTLGV